MNILLASSEVFPYSKTGGLADMVGALSKALGADGNNVTVITPLYRGIREKHPKIQPTDLEFSLPLGGLTVDAKAWSLEPAENVEVLFVEQDDFFNRPALYGEGGRDYPDNAARFVFLSKAVAHLARTAVETPEVVHVHDWQVGLVPLLGCRSQTSLLGAN